MKKIVLLFILPVLFNSILLPQGNFYPFRVQGSEIFHMQFVGNKTFYISSNSYLLKTTNYFQSFDTLFHYPDGNFLFYIDTAYQVSERIIVIGANDDFYTIDTLKQKFISLDGGQTWNPLNSYKTKFAFAGEKIFASNGNTNNIVVSTDNGNTWSNVKFPDMTSYSLYKYIFTDKTYNLYISVISSNWRIHILYKSSNNGVSWEEILKIVDEPVWWQIVQTPDYLIISPNTGKTYIYNTSSSALSTINLRSDYAYADTAGMISLLNFDMPPTATYFKISSNGGTTWQNYSINFWYDARDCSDLLMDDYGFLYLIKFNKCLRNDISLYKYIVTGSLDYGVTATHDTTFKKITIYNPTTKTLHLDSVITYSSRFFAHNFNPINIPPQDSTEVEIGFTPWEIGLFTDSAKIYLEKILLEVKLKGNGVVTNITDNFKNIKYSLSQNYPNPFNPSTSIKYELPLSCHVSLKVLNILGQEVITLVNELKDSGTYTIDFIKNTNMPSGVYFYQLKAGEFTSTKKMVILK